MHFCSGSRLRLTFLYIKGGFSMKKLLSILLAVLMVISIVPLAYAEGNNTYEVGDIIEFGSYPQTEVKDEDLIAELNALVPEWDDWTSYRYYSGTGNYGTMEQGDWMRYVDVKYDDETYRAVKFAQYRPIYTYYSFSNDTIQYDNGYSIGEVYWFKFESINWRVLDPSVGLVMCETIIDAQPYSSTIYYKSGASSGYYAHFNDASYKNYANDYETSSIRKWLKNDFYNTAFSDREKNEINTITLSGDNFYTSIGESLTDNDKIFLLSYSEVTNSNYGFNSSSSVDDVARFAKGSDYAKSQGLSVHRNDGGTYNGNSHWLLRSPSNSSDTCQMVYFYGRFVSPCFVYGTCYGVRPAFCFSNIEDFNHEHTYTSEVTTEATHFEEGEITYTCACGDSYTEKTPVKGHSWDFWIPDIPATCTTDGHSSYRSCICGAEFQKEVYPALNHKNSIFYDAKEATCTEDGYTAYSYCPDCNQTFGKTTIPSTGHTYVEVVTAPTCTAKGYTTYTCACDDTYVDNYTDKLDHEYTSEVTTEPTHLTEGVKTFTCKCGDTYTEAIAKLEGHTDIQADNYCDVCGEYIGVIKETGSCGEKVSYVLYEDGTLFISGEGAMYNYSSSNISPFKGSVIKSVIISDGVTTIGDSAFYNCRNLISITIPSSVTSIGNTAFCNCGNLTSVTILDGVISIGDKAFTGCSSLTNITIPSSVTNMGNSVFYNCGSLTSIIIPDSVSSIGSYMFYYCYKLKSITIPDSVTSIGPYAFYSCSNLTSVTIPNSVISIGEYAFSKCTSLTTARISDSVTNSDSVTAIGDYAFYDCEKLTSAIIGNGVTSIGEWAFHDCEKLTSLIIGNGVTIIGDNAFWNCKSLTKVTIPYSVTSIGEWVFKDCDKLTIIEVDKNNNYYTNDEYGVLFNKEKTLLIQYPVGNERKEYIVPDGVTTIDDWAFSSCDRIKSVTIPNTVTRIEWYTFDSCYNLTDLYYIGSEEQWKRVFIWSGNDCLLNATTHFAVNGHIFGDWYKENEPTCTVDGKNRRDCFYCSEYEESVIPALGHTYTSQITKQPTHKEVGVKTFTCECGDTYTESISVIPHSYDEIVTAPTCTERGYTTYICECGDSYVADEVSAKGHNHFSVVTTQPTHLKEGVETFTCACGDTYTKSISKLTEHTYTEQITKEPTHKEEGVKTFTCECGDSYIDPVAKIPHSYSKVVTVPTCTSKGYTTYTCACGDSYVGDYTGTKSHNYSSIVTKPATHLSTGVKTYTCGSCGNSYTESIAKTPEHTYTTSKITNPTCTDKGYTTYFCDCGDTYKDSYTSSTGHKYNGQTCVNCGKKCSCNCHKSGFMGFIWKIILFFNKLFKTNKTCACGVKHY